MNRLQTSRATNIRSFLRHLRALRATRFVFYGIVPVAAEPATMPKNDFTAEIFSNGPASGMMGNRD
jgi:hypothetical protein